MTDHELRSHVEQLIIDGNLEDAIRLLSGVVTASPALGFLRNETSLLLARNASLRRDLRTGVLSAGEAGTELQRLRQSALELVEEVVRRSNTITGPYIAVPIATSLSGDVGLEKIIGAVSHLKSIAWLGKGLDAAKSVCRIVTPEGLGTGFMIRPGVVATNHHVLPSKDVAKKSRAEFNYQETLSGTIEAMSVYEIDGAKWAGDYERDCAVVHLNVQPSAPFEQWGTLGLELSSIPPIKSHVSIIQHPNGGPKQIALTANQVVSIFGHRLQYTTDTLPGSSGSPVFNDEWKVVAIHHKGGNLVTNEAGDKRFINEGILVKYLGPMLAM